jgi:hypothetical protein
MGGIPKTNTVRISVRIQDVRYAKVIPKIT